MDPILEAALEVTRDTNYSFAGAITFVICDIFQKFDDEVAYIWKARWSLPKILYLIARYYSLALLITILVASLNPNPSVKFCQNLIKISSLAGTCVCNLVVDLICVIRIHALFGGSRRVLISLLVLTFGFCGAGFYFSAIQTTFPPVPEPLPFHFDMAPCLGARTVTPEMLRLLPVSWSLNLALASTFFFMTLFKIKDSLKDGNGKIRFDLLKNWTFVHPLLAILVVDGALVFLLFAGILGLSAFMSIYKGGFYYTPCWPWLYAMYSYSGSILILNLRRLGGAGTPTSLMSRRHGGLGPETLGLAQLTRMQFESNTAITKTSEVTEFTQGTIETNGNHDTSTLIATQEGSSPLTGHSYSRRSRGEDVA